MRFLFCRYYTMWVSHQKLYRKYGPLTIDQHRGSASFDCFRGCDRIIWKST